jgi:hypothetical protein
VFFASVRWYCCGAIDLVSHCILLNT